MLFATLSSGSSGNSYAFWNGDSAVLVDMGLSAKGLQERFDALDLDPWMFQDVLISHYHGDHVAAIRPWIKKHGGCIHTHAETQEQVPYLRNNPYLVNNFEYREAFMVGSFRITPWPVIHDTPGAVTFAIEDGRHKVALILETGRITAEIAEDARDADALIIEANHDPGLVTQSVNEGSIPLGTGQRILQTHLRNATAARFIAEHKRAKVAVLAHLSEDRNSPELAVKAVEEALAEEFRPADDILVLVASQSEPSPVIDLDSFVKKPRCVSVQDMHRFANPAEEVLSLLDF